MKEHYTLAALDMDGTLLNPSGEVTPRTREAVRRAAEAGKRIVLATGRCLTELEEPLQALEKVSHIICENGACLYDVNAGRAIRQIVIAPEEVVFAIREGMRYDIVLQCFIGNRSHVSADDRTDFAHYRLEPFEPLFRKTSVLRGDLAEYVLTEMPVVEKVNLYFAREEDRAAAFERIRQRPVTAVCCATGIGLEVSPPDIDKGAGLAALCAMLNIPLDETVAIGDSGNDASILQTAGLAVAMKNATEDILTLADVVTDDNAHDGAAKAIEKYLL